MRPPPGKAGVPRRFSAPARRLSPAPDTPKCSPWYYITAAFGFSPARLSVVSFALRRRGQCR